MVAFLEFVHKASAICCRMDLLTFEASVPFPTITRATTTTGTTIMSKLNCHRLSKQVHNSYEFLGIPPQSFLPRPTRLEGEQVLLSQFLEISGIIWMCGETVCSASVHLSSSFWPEPLPQGSVPLAFWPTLAAKELAKTKFTKALILGHSCSWDHSTVFPLTNTWLFQCHAVWSKSTMFCAT